MTAGLAALDRMTAGACPKATRETAAAAVVVATN